MVEQDKSAYEMKCQLEDNGVDTEIATMLTDRAEEEIEAAISKQATKDIFWGGLIFFGGLALTLGSRGAAIFYGAIIVGLVKLAVGISKKM